MSPRTTDRARVLGAIAILAVALAAKVVYETMFRSTGGGVPLSAPLSALDLDVPGGWRASTQDLEEEVDRKAGVADYVNCYYERDHDWVWLYLGYYDGTRNESIHQPKVCFPGAGWKTEEEAVREFDVEGVGAVPFNFVRFRRDGLERLTAFTFYYEGRFVTDQSAIEKGRVFGDRHFAILTLSSDVRSSRERTLDALTEILDAQLPRILDALPRPRTAAAVGRADCSSEKAGVENGENRRPGRRPLPPERGERPRNRRMS